MPVAKGYQVVPVDRFWPRHWFWYMLLGFVLGLGVGHLTGTTLQLYVPEGDAAAHLRGALENI